MTRETIDMGTRQLLCAILAVLGLTPALASETAAPLVVAVDTSRSVSREDLTALQELIGLQAHPALAQDPTGLVAFDDEVTWVLRPGGAQHELGSSLSKLAPRGSYTVLHDALFIIARDLTRGGVILLATDGRDENSATTLEDVARECTRHDVRIVALAVGGKVDEKGLRRLALLTDGAYVGRLQQVAPDDVENVVDQARQAVLQRAAGRAVAVAEQEAVSDEVGPRQEPGSATSSVPWRLLLSAGVLIGAVVLALWLMLRRGQEPSYAAAVLVGDESEEHTPADRRPDDVPQRLEDEQAFAYDELSPAATQGIRLVASQQPVAEMAIPDASLLGPEAFEKAPLPDVLEQTLVIDEQPVLIVREQGKAPRSYSLPRDSTFAVGRAPRVNTLQVADPAVSSQHFKIVPKDGEFYVVDLDTTNGTSVNSRRVKARRLTPGDVIVAGCVEVEYNLSIRRVS